MPSPPDGPEFWVEDASDDGWPSGDDWSSSEGLYGSQTSAWDASRSADDEPSLPGPPPRGLLKQPRRWVRWAALATGLVVIAGIVAWQSRTGPQPDAAGGTVTATQSSKTTPSTWAPTATDPSPAYTTPVDAPTSFVIDGDDVQVSGWPAELTDGTLVVVAPTPQTEGQIEAISTNVDVLPGTQGWQLQAYRRPLQPGGRVPLDGSAALIRYRPDDGALSAVRLPGLNTTGPVSFASSGGTAIIRPASPDSGYVVSPSGAVSAAAGLLAQPNSAIVVPGPGRGQLWVVDDSTFPATITLSNTGGTPLGAEFTAPDAPAQWWAQYGSAPDGAGYLTFSAVSGIYLLQPYGSGFHRITTGTLLATGPSGFLTYDCDDVARCAVYDVDRATWSRSKVDVDYVPSGGMLPSGVISPDGATVALADFGGSGATVYLLDLATGRKQYTDVSLADMVTSTGAGFFAFSPDSRYLMVAGAGGVVPVDVGTGKALATLPTGPVDALAIEATG